MLLERSGRRYSTRSAGWQGKPSNPLNSSSSTGSERRGRSRALDGVEILSQEGNTYVETIDEQRDLWQVALACWDLVAELLEVQFSIFHTFTVDLDSGMVHAGVDSMSLHDPAAYVTMDGQLVRN